MFRSIRLVEYPEQPPDQDDQQDCTEAHTGPPAIAPTAMPVVSAATTQQQNENDDKYQHLCAPYSISAPGSLLAALLSL
jgi:hypothetical protein